MNLEMRKRFVNCRVRSVRNMDCGKADRIGLGIKRIDSVSNEKRLISVNENRTF